MQLPDDYWLKLQRKGTKTRNANQRAYIRRRADYHLRLYAKLTGEALTLRDAFEIGWRVGRQAKRSATTRSRWRGEDQPPSRTL